LLAPVTEGLNQTAVDLDLLFVHRSYPHNIGASGTPLTISADKVVHEGGGTLHYKDGDGTTDKVIVKSENQELAAELDGDTITRLIVAKGKVLCKATLGVVARLDVTYMNHIDSDAIVDFETGSGGTAVTIIWMNGGNVTIRDRQLANIAVAGGVLTLDNDCTVAASSAWATMGGRLASKASGTIGWLFALSGTVDLTEHIAATTVSILRLFPGAILHKSDDFTTTTGGAVVDRGIAG
jgi:hypothetical protein